MQLDTGGSQAIKKKAQPRRKAVTAAAPKAYRHKQTMDLGLPRLAREWMKENYPGVYDPLDEPETVWRVFKDLIQSDGGNTVGNPAEEDLGVWRPLGPLSPEDLNFNTLQGIADAFPGTVTSSSTGLLNELLGGFNPVQQSLSSPMRTPIINTREILQGYSTPEGAENAAYIPGFSSLLDMLPILLAGAA